MAPDFAAIPLARRAVASWLDENGATPMAADDVLLVLSELLTNAVRASIADGTAVRLRIADADAGFCITVADRGPGFAVRGSSADPFRDGGRGLPVVREIATELDIRRRANGWTVVNAVVAHAATPEPTPSSGGAAGFSARAAKRIRRPGSALSAL